MAKVGEASEMAAPDASENGVMLALSDMIATNILAQTAGMPSWRCPYCKKLSSCN